jgi:hypothetical protein
MGVYQSRGELSTCAAAVSVEGPIALRPRLSPGLPLSVLQGCCYTYRACIALFGYVLKHSLPHRLLL